MLRKSMMAMAGAAVGLTPAMIASPAHAAEPAPAAPAASTDDASILAICGGGTARDSKFEQGGKIVVPSTGNNSGNYDCTLREVNSSPGVRKLQDALVKCHNKNLGPNGIDGVYGTYTRIAVQSIQAQTGLEPDGIYGPQTKLKIFWPIYHGNTWFGGCERIS